MSWGSSTVQTTTRTPRSCDIATTRSTKIGTRPSLTGTCAKGALAKAFGGHTPALAHINNVLNDRQPSAVVTPGTSLWT